MMSLKYLCGGYGILFPVFMCAGIPEVLMVENKTQKTEFLVNENVNEIKSISELKLEEVSDSFKLYRFSYATKRILTLKQNNHTWHIEYYDLPDNQDYCQISAKHICSDNEKSVHEDVAVKEKSIRNKFFLLVLQTHYSEGDTLIKLCDN